MKNNLQTNKNVEFKVLEIPDVQTSHVLSFVRETKKVNYILISCSKIVDEEYICYN